MSLSKLLADGRAHWKAPLWFRETADELQIGWTYLPKQRSVHTNVLASLDEHTRFFRTELPNNEYALLLETSAPHRGRDARNYSFIGWAPREQLGTLDDWIGKLNAYLDARRATPPPSEIELAAETADSAELVAREGDGHDPTLSRARSASSAPIWSPDGRFIVRRGHRCVVIYAADDLRCREEWSTDPVLAIAFSPDSRFLAIASGDYDDGGTGMSHHGRGTINIVRLGTTERAAALHLTAEPIRIQFDPSSTRLWYALEFEGREPARSWDFGGEPPGADPPPILPEVSSPPTAVEGEDVASPDGARVARLVRVGAGTGCCVLEVGDRRERTPLGPIRALHFTTNRELLVEGTFSSETWVDDAGAWTRHPRDHAPLPGIRETPPFVYKRDLHASIGKRVFAVIDSRKRRQLVNKAERSRAADRLAIRTSDTLVVVDLSPDFAPGRILEAPRDFTCLAFSPDGWMLALGDEAGAVSFWRLGSPLEIARGRVRQALEERLQQAERDARDPYWGRGSRSVKQWTADAYRAALEAVDVTSADADDAPGDHLARVAGAIRALRDREPEADDEAWYASAIDDAAALCVA